MKVREKLTALIQSLTTDEKRFFTIMVGSNNKEQHYLQLFNAIEQDGDMAYKLFKAKYAKAPWTSNYSANQQYLYNQILRSLLLQHAQKDELLHTLNQIQYWRLLSLRGFYQQGFDFLDAAANTANAGDSVLMRLIIESFKFHSQHSYIQNNDKIDSYLSKIQLNLANLLSLQQDFSFYLEQYTLQNIIYTFISNLSATLLIEITPKIQELYERQVYLQHNLPQNPASLALYWFNHHRLHNLLGLPNTENGFNKSIAVLENNPTFLEHRLEFYPSVVLSAILEKLRLSELSNIAVLFEKIDPDFYLYHKMPSQKYNIRKYLHLVVYLDYYICTGVWQDVKHWRELHLDFLKKYIAQQPNNIQIYAQFILGASYFINHEHKQAEEWLAIFLQPANMRNEYHYQAQILNLLMLWREEEWALLDIKMSAFRRLLKNKKEYSPFYHHFFLFLKYSISQPDNRKKALRRWANYLVSKKNYAVYDLNNSFPYTTWAAQELIKI
jgi:hypothetical protein